MSSPTAVRTRLAALFLAAPLMLVACGTDTADPEGGAPAGSGGDTAATAATEAEPTTGAAAPDATDPDVAADRLVTEELTYVEADPVTGGAEAGEADRAEIEALVRGLYETETLHEFLSYLPENTCREVAGAPGAPDQPDFSELPDTPLAELPGYLEARPYVESVTDLRVDGDVASASVTAVSDGQENTATQRYLREDGAWTFCN